MNARVGGFMNGILFTLRLLFIAILKFYDLGNCVFCECFNFASLQRFC